MIIVVAPDSFKGNLTAVQVADYIEKGIKQAGEDIQVIKIPVADGGEGTVEALVTATSGRIYKKTVSGPLMGRIEAFYGILGDGETAIIEMAAAAGLNLLAENKRNPLETTTYGVGELILEVIEYGCKNIVLGIGGSCTNDGGMGMAQALGVRFFSKEGRLLSQGGKHLKDVYSIDVSGMDMRIREIKIVVACDVNNPMYGPNGATYIYGPQKGATSETLAYLDDGMMNYTERIKDSLGIDMADIPGSGAAGGLGGGLIAFAGALLQPGIDIVIQHSKFDDIIKGADLLITGEGKTDYQTAFGKVPVGLSCIASKYGVPVICLSGGLGEGYENIYEHGIDAAFSTITDAMPLHEAMGRSGSMLTQAAYAITRLVRKIKYM